MDGTELELDGIATNDTRADWTVDAIAEQMVRTLNGSVTREAILQLIEQVAPKYENARIQTFVPILIQRDVMNALFTMQETSAPLGAGIKEVY